MFKKDQFVILVDSSALSSIRAGKKYKVAEDQKGDGEWLAIYNDAGEKGEYRARRFKAAKTLFTDVPVGTAVFCILYGEGVIYTTTRDSDAYKVGVKFSRGNTNTYTADGKNNVEDAVPILYYAKPEINAPEAPVFVSKMIGKEVLVTYQSNGSYFKVGKVTGETETSFIIDGNPLLKTIYYFNEIGAKL